MTVEELPYPLNECTSSNDWRPVWESDTNVASIGRDKHKSIAQSAHNNVPPVKAVYGWYRIA